MRIPSPGLVGRFNGQRYGVLAVHLHRAGAIACKVAQAAIVVHLNGHGDEVTFLMAALHRAL
jgi:hypothetical protein